MNNDSMFKFVLVGAGVFVALAALGVNVATLLPLLIILACPLMMIFMMRGMDHGGGHGDDHEHAHDEHVHHGTGRDEQR